MWGIMRINRQCFDPDFALLPEYLIHVPLIIFFPVAGQITIAGTMGAAYMYPRKHGSYPTLAVAFPLPRMSCKFYHAIFVRVTRFDSLI